MLLVFNFTAKIINLRIRYESMYPKTMHVFNFSLQSFCDELMLFYTWKTLKFFGFNNNFIHSSTAARNIDNTDVLSLQKEKKNISMFSIGYFMIFRSTDQPDCLQTSLNRCWSRSVSCCSECFVPFTWLPDHRRDSNCKNKLQISY